MSTRGWKVKTYDVRRKKHAAASDFQAYMGQPSRPVSQDLDPLSPVFVLDCDQTLYLVCSVELQEVFEFGLVFIWTHEKRQGRSSGVV